MATRVAVNNTTNRYLLEAFDWKEGTFRAAAAGTFPEGLLLGRVTSTGNWVPYDPTATDGSQVVRGVLNNEIVATAAGNHHAWMLSAGRVRLHEIRVLVAGNLLVPDQAALDALHDIGVFASTEKFMTKHQD